MYKNVSTLRPSHQGQREGPAQHLGAGTRQSPERTSDDFWEELGITPPPGPHTEPLNVRVDADLRMNLDRIEAFLRGAGYRDVSRSDLVRAALSSFVAGVLEAVPDVGTVTLPEERRRHEATVTQE